MKRLILIFASIFSIVFATQANIYTVTSNADAGAGTLRQAIQDAAGSAVGLPHVIIFSTAMTITINSDLQINAGNHNGITINGFVDLLDGPDVIIRSGGTLNNQMVFNNTVAPKIYGLVFQNLDYGIHLNTVTGAQIKGCYFGTDVTGTTIVNGINQAGVYVQNGGTTANNIIGGLLTNLAQGVAAAAILNNSERCIFAGCAQKTNAGAGVRVPALLVTDAGGTQVINNYFGLDATGTVKLGNGNQTTKMPLAHSNIYMNNAINSVIDRNVIAGATGSGIHLENWCNNAKIKGNKIGTNAAGTAAYNGTTSSLSFSNEAAGIFIQGGTGMVIGYDGGTIVNERNIIAGNGGAKHNNWQQTCDGGFSDYNQFGIYTESLGNSTIKGNYIGTDVTGNSSGVGNVFGNRAGGIKMVTVNGVGSSNSQNNIIGGGTTANDRNIIAGNGYLWKANDNTSTCNGGTPNPSNMVGGPGLLLQYANTSANTVSGNYIGLGADGLTALGNNANGIEIQGAASNNIGTPGVPNYICNNTWGIFLQVDFGSPFVPAANNTIAGNIIGLTPTNTVLGNGVRAGLTEGGGIGMQMGVNGTKIGTAVTDGGNVISGNRIGVGIQTNSVTAGATAPNGNTMYNNIIGLDPTGTIAKPNTAFGVAIDMGGQGTVFPFNNTIGGTGANQANIISSNQLSGIYISHTAAITLTAANANSIIGNNIGTNLAGTADRGNTLEGIQIVNVSRTTITSNLISGNDHNGILLTGSSLNTIQNNIIGSNASKTAPIANTMNGIFVSAGSASNIIGGTVANEPNFIFNNGINGVLVDGATSISNSIHQNSFSCNTGRGIVLSSGGNNNILTATILGSPSQLVYTNPNAFATRIEIFETDGCATCPTDPTRLQGKTFVTSGNITAGGTFVFTTALTFNPAKLYTAILHEGGSITTTAARNTSEFTVCYVLCSNPTPSITGTTILCEGTTGATFTVSPITTGSSYAWSLPAGVTGSSTTSSITVAIGAAPITGNISVTETVLGGCTGSANATLTIKAKPTLVSAGTTQNLCSATSAALVGSTLPSGTIGAWSVLPSGPTFVNAANASTTANGLVPGTNYTFTWSVTNAPCAAVTATSTVNNPIKPTPSITGTTVLCEGTTGASFSTASVTGNNYSWSLPTGVTGSSTTSSITVAIGAAPITGSVSVTESSSVTCSTTATATLTIKAKPTLVSAGTTQNLCSATSAALVGSTLPSGTTGAWSVLPSGPTFVNAANASTTANGLVPGTNYTFTWSVTNAPCAAVTATSTVNNPIKPTPSIAGTTVLCEGTTGATFNTASVTGNNYSWTVPTGVIINGSTTSSSITTTIGAAPITGSVSVTESSSVTCSTTATATLTIKAKPTLVSGGADQNLCSATSAALVGSTLPSGTTGAWSVLPSGPTFVNAANASTTANGLVPGTNYTFTWSVTNAPCAAVTATSTVNNPIKPTPAITGTTTLCEGTTGASFSTASVTGNNYSWTLPTGVTGSSTTSSITVGIAAAPITGNVSVTETSSATCSTTATAPLTIKAKPTLVSAGTDQELCASTTVALTGSTLPSGTTGAWTVSPSGPTFVDAANASTTANGLVGATDYTFTWSVTNAPCTPVSSTVVISNKPQPTAANAGANQSTCNTDEVTLTGNTPTTGTGSWSVIPTTGISFDNASSPSAKASGLSTGTVYTFTWSITNAPCPASTATANVERTNIPTPFIDGAGAQCSSFTTTLSVNSANPGSTYTWEVVSGSGDATITSSTTGNPITVNSGLTGGVIRVKETNGGCINIEATTTISISADNAFVEVGKGYTTCLGSIELPAYIPSSGGGSWSMVLPSDAIFTPATPQDLAKAENLTDGNIYKFVYTVSGACGDEKTDTLVVTAGLPNFIVQASGPSDTVCVKTNRMLLANASGGSGNYTYVWVSSDKSYKSNGNQPVITVQPVIEKTIYIVYVVDKSNPGCKTKADSVEIAATKGQDLYLPNLITPNGDNKNDIFYLRDKVTYMPMLQAGSHIEVVNRWGSKVYEADNYDNTWVPKDLTDGMYYYHITNQCGNKEYKSWLQILGNTNN